MMLIRVQFRESTLAESTQVLEYLSSGMLNQRNELAKIIDEIVGV